MRDVLIGIILSSAVLGTACGGGAGSPASPSQISSLTGTWRASKAEFVNSAGNGSRVDVVAQGTVVTLVLEAATFRFSIADPGLAGNVTTGTWSASKDVLKLTPTGMSWSYEFDMALNGNTLTLNGGSAEFDFEGDGKIEQAKLNLTLSKQ